MQQRLPSSEAMEVDDTSRVAEGVACTTSFRVREAVSEAGRRQHRATAPSTGHSLATQCPSHLERPVRRRSPRQRKPQAVHHVGRQRVCPAPQRRRRTARDLRAPTREAIEEAVWQRREAAGRRRRLWPSPTSARVESRAAPEEGDSRTGSQLAKVPAECSRAKEGKEEWGEGGGRDCLVAAESAARRREECEEGRSISSCPHGCDQPGERSRGKDVGWSSSRPGQAQRISTGTAVRSMSEQEKGAGRGEHEKKQEESASAEAENSQRERRGRERPAVSRQRAVQRQEEQRAKESDAGGDHLETAAHLQIRRRGPREPTTKEGGAAGDGGRRKERKTRASLQD